MSDLTVYSLIALGCLVLVSNFVNIPSLLAKMVVRKKESVTPINNVNNVNKDSTFLEIVDLWYQLKRKCDSLNLSVASKKLDEVFPLLNISKTTNDDKNV